MRGQTVGRFDLHDRPPVRYLAESPVHAVGEALAPFRGTALDPSYFRLRGHALALVPVTLAPSLAARLPDCTDPATLLALGVRPDELAHHDRRVTQAVARRLHARGKAAGFRWWSALTGAWHATIVFTDRERPGEVSFGTPCPVDPSSAEVGLACSLLGIDRRTR